MYHYVLGNKGKNTKQMASLFCTAYMSQIIISFLGKELLMVSSQGKKVASFGVLDRQAQ